VRSLSDTSARFAGRQLGSARSPRPFSNVASARAHPSIQSISAAFPANRDPLLEREVRKPAGKSSGVRSDRPEPGDLGAGSNDNAGGPMRFQDSPRIIGSWPVDGEVRSRELARTSSRWLIGGLLSDQRRPYAPGHPRLRSPGPRTRTGDAHGDNNPVLAASLGKAAVRISASSWPAMYRKG
jgi:hypothetical protein